jgi:death-on-curing protein
MAARIRWLSVKEVYAFHDLALREHGGMPGLRDAGLLESVVLRPKTAYEYGTSDLAELTAKLAFGLVSNPAFFDGEKRTALLASLTFLRLNGKKFTASESEIAAVLIDTANHELSENELVHWFKERTEKLEAASVGPRRSENER